MERVEELLCLEVFCVFATGIEIESPKGHLVGDALFVLYPVEPAVAVAAVAVVVIETAGSPTDRRGRCFATVERLKCWEMIAHGKVIELTSGRWKEIWAGQRGVRISKIASRRVWPVLTLFVAFFLAMYFVHAKSRLL